MQFTFSLVYVLTSNSVKRERVPIGKAILVTLLQLPTVPINNDCLKHKYKDIAWTMAIAHYHTIYLFNLP